MKYKKQLTITLRILGIYLAILGILFLLVPGMAEKVFKISLPDPVLTALYGQVLIIIALMCFLVAADAEKYANLLWVFIAEQVGHVVILGFFLINGTQNFQQVGPSLIINIIFLIALLLFSAKEKAT
ncbi:hypothetical protein H8E88_17115 [candidate division KSB1 bacterium]|nr:hypothetical protein [candidate division KSB1 bacterium]